MVFTRSKLNEISKEELIEEVLITCLKKLMMMYRSGRGISYDVTDYLQYKNLLIMQNLEKIMLKQAFWLSTVFFSLRPTFVRTT